MIKITASSGAWVRTYSTGEEMVWVHRPGSNGEWTKKKANQIQVGDEVGPFCLPMGGCVTVETVEVV